MCLLGRLQKVEWTILIIDWLSIIIDYTIIVQILYYRSLRNVLPNFSRAIDYGAVDPKFVDYLNFPNSAFGFSPFQTIERLVNQRMEQSLFSLFHFLIPSTAFLALMTSGCLLMWLFSTMLSGYGKNTQIKILSFCYLLFLFFVQQLFGGNLNTDNVVVRTDDLLSSKEQVLRTNKELCVYFKISSFPFFPTGLKCFLSSKAVSWSLGPKPIFIKTWAFLANSLLVTAY